ncbi:NADase-type glycan-binding domain-containing protein [Streptomyces sp. IPPR8]|uniref:NADase-type glycan-binding domain-containing protein n=1 Tax=Streptomyces sp. IPPR8 TaxID=3417301 RepID=UPI003D68929F
MAAGAASLAGPTGTTAGTTASSAPTAGTPATAWPTTPASTTGPTATAGPAATAPAAGTAEAPAPAPAPQPTAPAPSAAAHADTTPTAHTDPTGARPPGASTPAWSTDAAPRTAPPAPEPAAATPGPVPPRTDGPPPTSPAPARDTEDTAPTAPLTPEHGAAPNALSDTMNHRARSLLVPVADPETPAVAPPPAVAPVLPGRPDADRPQVRAPGHQPDIANGPPCPWCSTPNRPDRHYCARCAMPLTRTGEADTRPAPWWRRLFGGRREETPWAGDRPRLRRVFDRIGTWITLAVVITLVVLGFVYVPDGVQATRDHFAKRAPVSPDRITASRSFPGHQPELLVDKRSNTWWGPGISQSGQGQWVEVGFTEPTRLLDLIITPGTSTKPDQLNKSALPHRVEATITKKDGSTMTRDLTLDQGAGGQRRPFRVGEVTKVRFTIESAHAASANKQVAIAEIEFFGPSSANRA